MAAQQRAAERRGWLVDENWNASYWLDWCADTTGEVSMNGEWLAANGAIASGCYAADINGWHAEGWGIVGGHGRADSAH